MNDIEYKEMNEVTNSIRKVIDTAMIDFQSNPAFYSFKVLNQPARYANKLVKAGYNAKVLFEKCIIIYKS